MEPSQTGLFELADQRLKWLGARQQALAQNVANADTPGWKARDVAPFSAVLEGQIGLSASAPVRTNAFHLAGTVSSATGANAVAGERAPDGNQVSLDQQLEKIAQTDTQHETVTAIYQKYIGMFRMVLGR
jgi:flagellar basal-body rod protein FlgB